MQTLMLFLGLLLSFWLLSHLWLGKYRVIGVVLSPILAAIAYQGIGYIALGYFDPFAIVAIIVTLIIGVVTIFCLEMMREKALREFMIGLLAMRIRATGGVLILGLIFSYPAITQVQKQWDIRNKTDAYMLEQAENAVRKILVHRLDNLEGTLLKSTFDRGENFYAFQLIKNGKILAKIKLDAVTLEALSVDIREKE